MINKSKLLNALNKGEKKKKGVVLRKFPALMMTVLSYFTTASHLPTKLFHPIAIAPMINAELYPLYDSGEDLGCHQSSAPVMTEHSYFPSLLGADKGQHHLAADSSIVMFLTLLTVPRPWTPSCLSYSV